MLTHRQYLALCALLAAATAAVVGATWLRMRACDALLDESLPAAPPKVSN